MPSPGIPTLTSMGEGEPSRRSSGTDEMLGAQRADRATREVLALQAAANGLGVVGVAVYLLVLFPESGADGATVELNLLVFSGYVVLVGLVALPINLHLLRRALAWAREGREPTQRERLETVLIPLRQTASAVLGWVGAAVVFGLLNDDPGRVSIGIVAAGLLTSAILFQLLERRFRPVMALALEGVRLPARLRWVLPRLMMAWLVASAIPLGLIGLGALSLPTAELAELVTRLPSVTAIALAAGGLVMVGAAKAVADPINEVREALARVADGDLGVHLPVDHVGEIGLLQDGVNQMVEGLRERQRIEELFSRQVGTDVARHALERDPGLGGEEREVSVLFVDLVGFTTFAEHHAPTEIVERLNAFFAAVVSVVSDEGGWLDKFEGDAALCVFGAPADQPDHAVRALRAASRLPTAVAQVPGSPLVGVGVATGTVVAGNVGTAERYEYTVIGDPVNVASRLADLAKEASETADDGGSGPVLAGEATVRSAGAGSDGGPATWEPAGDVRVRGRGAPVAVWRPVVPVSSRRGRGASSHPTPRAPRATAPGP